MYERADIWRCRSNEVDRKALLVVECDSLKGLVQESTVQHPDLIWDIFAEQRFGIGAVIGSNYGSMFYSDLGTSPVSREHYGEGMRKVSLSVCRKCTNQHFV